MAKKLSAVEQMIKDAKTNQYSDGGLGYTLSNETNAFDGRIDPVSARRLDLATDPSAWSVPEVSATGPLSSFGDIVGAGDASRFNNEMEAMGISREEFANYNPQTRQNLIDDAQVDGSTWTGDILGEDGQFAGVSSEGWENIGSGVTGALNLGMGLGSYLDQKKTQGLQRDVYRQMLESNRDQMDRSKAVSSAATSAFARR